MSEIHGSNPDDQTAPPPSQSAAGESDFDRRWREVFEESTPGLRAFLRGRLGQDSDVDDCLQIVFVKMIESGHQVAPAAHRAWLFRVAANESARMWRTKASTQKMLGRHGGQEAAEQDPSRHVILTETTQELHRAVRQLPAVWQEIVRLRIEENLTFQQIATQLDMPLGTALTRMRRALERLKNDLDSDEDDNAKSTKT